MPTARAEGYSRPEGSVEEISTLGAFQIDIGPLGVRHRHAPRYQKKDIKNRCIIQSRDTIQLLVRNIVFIVIYELVGTSTCITIHMFAITNMRLIPPTRGLHHLTCLKCYNI